MTADPDFGKRVVGKVTARLIPFIFICYVIAYLDRVNIGFVKGPLQADLSLSAEVFGRGALRALMSLMVRKFSAPKYSM